MSGIADDRADSPRRLLVLAARCALGAALAAVRAPPGSRPSRPRSPAGRAGAGAVRGRRPRADIDQILEGEEEVLSGSGFTYDPGNRRDPFKSLLAAPDRPGVPRARARRASPGC